MRSHSSDVIISRRINVMHHFWTKTFGYLIHPKIPVDGALRVADVGTGTGYVIIFNPLFIA